MSPLLLLAVAFGLIAVFVAAAYRRVWTWTGFVATDGGHKLLWDWLQLWIVPAGLSIALFALNAAQSQRAHRAEVRQAARDREAAADDTREQSLSTYLDRMSDLVLSHRLSESKVDPLHQLPAQVLARTWTITTLPRLDARRKGVVVAFLSQAGLITSGEARVSLDGADLRGAVMPSLQKADLAGADLRGADFSNVSLGDADPAGPGYDLAPVGLGGADLTGADFSHASLTGVDLRGARLRDADFRGATLGWWDQYAIGSEWTTVFDGADLRGADFSGAKLDNVGMFVSDLTGARFRKASVKRTDFSGSCLSDADFSGGALDRANFPGVDGVGLRLVGARLTDVRFTKRRMPAARSSLRDGALLEIPLPDARLSGVDLRGVRQQRTIPPGALLARPATKPSCRAARDAILLGAGTGAREGPLGGVSSGRVGPGAFVTEAEAKAMQREP